MDGRKAARPGQGRDAYYKNEWSKVLAENATLKQQLDELSRENHQLKNSLYTISLRHEGALESLAQSGKRQPSGSAGAAGGAASSRRGVEGHEPTDSMSVATSSDSEVRFAATAVDLKGHAGAVYAVQFSPCGHFLASGSFDKTVRVWSVEEQQELFCMQEHQLNVTDVAWSTDSLRLLSGGFDQAVKEWDTVTGELGYSFDAPGLVQALSYDAVNSNVFYVGSTQKVVTIVDRRQPDSQHATLRNDSFVNTLVVHELEGSLITGDADGMLKTWDLRAQGCVHQLSNDDQHKPISHIHMARPAIGLRGAAEGRHSDDDERRYLGVNSYDNVLRVYDRWVHAQARRGDINEAAAAAEASNDSPDSPIDRMSDKSPVKTPTRRSSGGTGVGRFSPGHEQSTSPQAGVAPELGDDLARSPTHRGDTRATQYSDTGLVCVMKGHKNKNWPIRSAFFQGANFSRYHKKEVAAGGVGHRRGADSGERAPFDDDEEQAVAAESDTRLKGAHDSLLLATGSADNLVYLFDVGETMARALRPNTEATKRRGDVVGTAPLLQQLHGHTDRVYAVHFHPTEPVLATGSADFTIKMWAPRRKAPSLTQPR